MFVDEAKIQIHAGRGGDGITSFRREKFVPRGGPNGGDGGKGGDVVVVATTNEHTLSAFRHQRRLQADDGDSGGPNNCTGANGQDCVVNVPVGTVLIDDDTGQPIVDLVDEGQRVIVAHGGEGGRGNTNFKSSTNRAPRRSTDGQAGQQRSVRLELKLIADVGLVGFPSVGKSTLISAISSAKPKVAAYPFTTLTPNLGMVSWNPLEQFSVADIPGLITGAHRGKGLGHEFLKHIERTDLLVHVLEVLPEAEADATGRDPIADFQAIRSELGSYDAGLLERPQMVCVNKIDLPFVAERVDELRTYFEDEVGLAFMAISAATHVGLDDFKKRVGHAVKTGQFDPSADLDDW